MPETLKLILIGTIAKYFAPAMLGANSEIVAAIDDLIKATREEAVAEVELRLARCEAALTRFREVFTVYPEDIRANGFPAQMALGEAIEAARRFLEEKE